MLDDEITRINDLALLCPVEPVVPLTLDVKPCPEEQHFTPLEPIGL